MKFYIEYESYMGNIDTAEFVADTEEDAKRMFRIARPLSEIRKIESYGNY